ncbi:hypothetical protein [Haladaptatus litoreus]|uniref:hypothetical protein n=1 Tax=Haladaptatus litoreus TaxID=553468 RepID=UPI0011156509|nr:hypothetical protein [Haladaptatus litoreus]
MYLEVVPGRELSWAQYYLGLGGVSVALMAAVWLEAFPFSLLPALVWGSFVASVFLLSGIAHVFTLRSSRLGASGEPPGV